MGYEESKAAHLVATNCACCGRPLVDAVSVETGIGPICRKKYWGDVDVSEAERRAANKMVYTVAAIIDEKPGEALEILPDLRSLGFDTLVDKIESRVIRVTVRQDDEVYIVRAPYSAEALPSWRKVGKWQKADKCYKVPVAKRKALWGLLLAHYKGQRAKGDKGYFVVGGAV